MRFLKGSLIGILAFLFSLCIAGMLASSVFKVSLGKPSNLKSWFSQSKIYEAAINNILTKASTAPDSKSLSQPEVQKLIKETLTPQVLQTTLEQIIDGTYRWLEGKSAKPDFVVDLTGLKNTFATNAGNAAVERLERLPICTNAQLQQLGTDVDPFEAPCKPSGIDLAAQKQKIIDEIRNSKDLLSDPLITADNFKVDAKDPAGFSVESAKQVPFYQHKNFSKAPKIYQWLQKAPFILAGLALLFAAGIVWLSSSHRKGLRRVAVSLLSVGILLVISVFAVNWLVNKLASNKNLFNPDVSADLQSAAIAFGKAAANSINQVLLALGITFVVIGGGAFVYLHFIHPKKQTEAKPPEEPETKDSPAEPPKSSHPHAMG